MCNLKFGSCNLCSRSTDIAVGFRVGLWLDALRTNLALLTLDIPPFAKFRNTSNSWSTGIARHFIFPIIPILSRLIYHTHLWHWHFSIWSRLDLLVGRMFHQLRDTDIGIPLAGTEHSVVFRSALIRIISGKSFVHWNVNLYWRR